VQSRFLHCQSSVVGCPSSIVVLVDRPPSQPRTRIAGRDAESTHRTRGLNGLLRFATGLHRTRATLAEQPKQPKPRTVEEGVRIHRTEDIAVVFESAYRGERRREVGQLLNGRRGGCMWLRKGKEILDFVIRHDRAHRNRLLSLVSASIGASLRNGAGQRILIHTCFFWTGLTLGDKHTTAEHLGGSNRRIPTYILTYIYQISFPHRCVRVEICIQPLLRRLLMAC